MDMHAFSPLLRPMIALPSQLPLFPLAGALLLPGGELPLNIFEPRYLAMIDQALRTDRMIGMIQPRTHDADMLYPIGCAGRITHYQELDDGRYLITLRGISRFRLDDKPRKTPDGYLNATIAWSDFTTDLTPCGDLPAHLCRRALKDLLNRFLHKEHLSVDWEQAACVSDAQFYTVLAMVAPLPAAEKQALLECTDAPARYDLLIRLLEWHVHAQPNDDGLPNLLH